MIRRRATRAAFASAAAVFFAGCSVVGSRSAPVTPEPVPDPVVSVDAPTGADEGITPPRMARPADGVDRDPIVHSRWTLHPEIRQRVAYWTERYAVRDGHAFPLFLERMAPYEMVVDSALAAEGLPRSLRYIPVIESGYLTSATSPMRAVGLWQFMAPTARSFGMHVSTLIDERRDPVKSTVAAARYLRELEERFGSWFLALAAYNSGPYRVESLLREHAPLAPQGDSLYTVIFPHLPSETRDFVPKLIAVASVAERLHEWGIEAPEPGELYAFDEVVVPDATSFDVVAEAAGVEEEVVRILNPHILRGLTPRGQPTTIRLPPGTADRFAEAYALIPPDRRVTVTEHIVSSGETLGGIAGQYGIRLSELQAANPGVNPRRMRIGTRLVVPVEGSTRPAAAPANGEHVVRSGESLWIIARRYDTTVARLRSLNGLREGAVLQPGDRIRIS